MSATRPALRGHLHATPAPDLPELSAPGVAAAGHRNVTKPVAVNKAPAPPVSGRDDVVSISPAVMIANVGADAGGLRTYRVALARAVASGTWRKELNPQVRGALEIGIAIDADGRVREIGLVRSSGQTELDRHLVEAVRIAVRGVTLPSVLQSQSLFVTLPIEVGTPISVADR